MKVRFLKKYKHTFKTFQKGDVVPVSNGFGKFLIKKKVATDNLTKEDI